MLTLNYWRPGGNNTNNSSKLDYLVNYHTTNRSGGAYVNK